MFEPEERRIAERIKDFIENENPLWYDYIILRDGRILDSDNYRKMVIFDKITPQDAYVDINKFYTSSKAEFSYPFLQRYIGLLNVCLSKQGLYYRAFVYPATGLKYIAFAADYIGEYFTIEVSSLDTIINNTNLRKIMFEVLSKKLISEDELTDGEYEEILDTFKSQRLFAGHNFVEAWNIIKDYYEGNKSLIKEVARITFDYERIFQPYRVCYKYEKKKWEEIDCLSIKL